jgi:hypothetical protein
MDGGRGPPLNRIDAVLVRTTTGRDTQGSP